MFKYDGVGPGYEPMLVDQIRALQAHARADAREIDTLQDALRSARRIGTAIGIVMATLRVTSEAAFDVLRAASQNGNRKLHEIADEVVLTGVVPRVAGPPRSPPTSAQRAAPAAAGAPTAGEAVRPWSRKSTIQS